MNQIKPTPLKFKTILSLIIVSSSCSMSFYLSYNIFNFIKSNNQRQSIFLPFLINFNYFNFMKLSYNLNYLNFIDLNNLNQSFDLLVVKSRLNFKIKNCIVNFKLLNLKQFKIIENNLDFKFIINNPTISGLTIDLINTNIPIANDHDIVDIDHDRVAIDHDQVDIDHNRVDIDHNRVDQDQLYPSSNSINFKNIKINYHWSIKLFNLNFFKFLLNQPTINFNNNDLNFLFNGEFGIYDLKNTGKIIFDGVIENNDIKFNNLVVIIEGDRIYKVI